MSLRRSLKLALAVLVASAALAFSSAAGAVPNPDYTAPPPSSIVDNFTPQQARATPVADTPSRSQLAITGSDAGQLVLMGGLLVAGGAATMALRRRNVAV